MRLRCLAAAALALGLSAASSAQASPFIEIRVSVKIIVDPFTLARPTIAPGSTTEVSDAQIAATLTRANNVLLSEYWRGYRFVLEGIEEIGATCPALTCTNDNPSYYFGDPFIGDLPLLAFETVAMSDPDYLWRTDALNVYINQGKGNGAVSSFPYDPPGADRSNHVTVVGSESFTATFSPNFLATLFHHELGHYFDLPHPNDKAASECCEIGVACVPGDGDQIEDTLPDNPCYDRDALSLFRYGIYYGSLNSAQKDSIDNIWTNNMSYLHPGQTYGQTIMDRLTEKQLDRWTDTANTARLAVVTGRTLFVERCGRCLGSGTSTDPYGSVGGGYGQAADGDILLLRPASYNETLTLSKRITLRATRTGPVVIGR